MEAFLKQETERLARSWMRHDAAALGSYLVEGVEDPRVNVQSILTRHFLLHALFGRRFEALMDHELHFAAAANWLTHPANGLDAAETRAAVLHALRRGADNAEGLELPAFLIRLFAELPAAAAGAAVPNYIEAVLEDGSGPGLLDMFQRSSGECLPDLAAAISGSTQNQ